MELDRNIVIEIVTQVDRIGSKVNDLKIEHFKSFEEVENDINKTIKEFNTTKQFYIPPTPNAMKLKKLLKGNKLPTYEHILKMLSVDSVLKGKVIHEFNESTYLNEVWDIEDIKDLYINLLILIYRTTLLNQEERLRRESAQISSTLEEMSALLALKGTVTTVFEGTKIWLKNWREEDFSEVLYNDLVNEGLVE